MAEDTPSLLDLARARNRKPGPTCPFTPILATHPRADEIAELLSAAGSEIQYSTAESVLNEIGVALKSDTISRHCRGKCACHRS